MILYLLATKKCVRIICQIFIFMKIHFKILYPDLILSSYLLSDSSRRKRSRAPIRINTNAEILAFLYLVLVWNFQPNKQLTIICQTKAADREKYKTEIDITVSLVTYE